MEKNPYIGQMNSVIQLVEKVKTRTETGSEISTNAPVCSPFAKMTDISGNEVVDGKVKHLVNRIYVVRFNDVIKSKGTALVLIDEGREFEVIHILELGRRQHLEIRVKIYE
ncbi:phage head completion protein [Flavobacterium sp. WC2509]|uniref:phage head completion protein n=1 Tax=Flavobacterium sp. WC2509 TaxID=3461406 RepID=UPI00404493FD